MDELKLTKDQQEVVDKLQEFFKDPTQDIFTLEGIAGTGKTTLLREVVRGRANVIACCVSHVAKSILISNMGDVADCMTVAQLLGLKMVITEEGEIEFVPQNNNPYVLLPIQTADIIIIDEASMIDDETYMRIMTMKRSHCKIVYSGDPFQLSPITRDKKDSDSKAFNHTKARLFKTLRYGGIISDLGNRIRTEIAKLNNGKAGSKNIINNWITELGYSERTSIIEADGTGVIFLNDIHKVVEIAKQFFVSDNINELRLIGFRRDSISTLNNVVRAQLYGAQYGTIHTFVDDNGEEDEEIILPQFIPGELIISDGGYKDLIHNNQTFKVVDAVPVLGPNDIDCFALMLDPMPHLKESQQILVVDHEKGWQKYKEIENNLKFNAKRDGKQWIHYYDFKKHFAVFEHALAINVHRGQGSTYNNSIIFENDIVSVTKNTVKAKLQSLYVACTRAKQLVFIYNKKYRVDQSQLPQEVKERFGL